ncbi:MAG: Mur ligase family protein [Polyangiaceae bacterium]
MTGVVTTLSELRAGDMFVALPFADGDAHWHVREALERGASLCMVSEQWPGLDALPAEMRARCRARPDVVASFRQLAADLRCTLLCPVAAVIGASGKTTTKEMLAAMLGGSGERVVKTPGTDNGFLGLPRTLCHAAFPRGEAPPGAVVLEIGIDAPGAMEDHARMVNPDLAIVTSLGAEHLRGLGDVATAIAEEIRLLEVAPSAVRVLPWGDPEVRSRAALLRRGDVAVVEEAYLRTGTCEEASSRTGTYEKETEAAFLRIAAREGLRVVAYSARSRGEGSAVTVKWYPFGVDSTPADSADFDVPLPGAHNARNFALAVAGALALGRPLVDIAAGWGQFEAPPWRSQIRPLARGALLFDDSFNATPPAVEAALAVLADAAWGDRPRVAFLGDMLDLGAAASDWHASLTASLRAVPGLRLFTFGPEMTALARSLRDEGKGPIVEATLADDGRDPEELAAAFELPARAVILVKGSRGMRMERLVRALQLRFPPRSEEAAEGPLTVVSTRAGATPAWMAVARNRLQEKGIRVTWIETSHHEIASSPAAREASIVVFGEPPLSDLLPGGDVERHLAEKAQLLLRPRGLRTVVLPAEDAGADLLAEVAPPAVEVSRFSTAESCAEAVVRAVVLALGTNRRAGGDLW